MYKITKQMLEEFQRVMSIRPKLYHDYCLAKYPHLLNEDEHEYKDDTNNDAAHCLLLSGVACLIYLAQEDGLGKDDIVKIINVDFKATIERYESVAIYKGRGKEKTLDWELAIEMNDGNFLEYCGIYNEESAPKIEAQAVLYTIEWYLQEAGIYDMPKWTYPEQEAEFMAQFKDFELI